MIWAGIQFAIGVAIGAIAILFICGFIGIVIDEYKNIKRENGRRKNAKNRKRKTLSE